MNEYLKLKSLNCKHCYKCIRRCPVKAIGFSSGQANILPEECILCGQCFVACPQNAKTIRNDLDKAKQLIAGDSPVYASVAPSFLANYPGVAFETLTGVLLKLGFTGAGETAEGATIIKNEYDKLVDENAGSILISSCCSSVNLLIQKYFPEVLPRLVALQSPMQAHSAMLKQQHEGAKTIFIGPCISKKAEAEDYPGIVDLVLTFDELEEWLASERLVLKADSAAEKSGKARFFPTSGGILKSMEKKNPAYEYLVVDGVENCIAALRDIQNGTLNHCFIEMSACAGSCVGGPAMANNNTLLTNSMQVFARTGTEDFAVHGPKAAALHKKMDWLQIKKTRPSESAICEVLAKIGKTKPEHELNCGCCGYESCRDKAAAVIEGKAELSMCLPYLSERVQSFSDTIISNTPNGIFVLNEALDVQQINQAACALLNIKDSKDVLGRKVVCILEPHPFIDVMDSGKNIYDERVFLAEYDKYVTQTIIYDKSYNIIIGIMRDVTEKIQESIQKEERSNKAIEITDKVIAKQMRTVQQIASLLGETTAETKVALTRLKETISDE